MFMLPVRVMDKRAWLLANYAHHIVLAYISEWRYSPVLWALALGGCLQRRLRGSLLLIDDAAEWVALFTARGGKHSVNSLFAFDVADTSHTTHLHTHTHTQHAEGLYNFKANPVDQVWGIYIRRHRDVLGSGLDVGRRLSGGSAPAASVLYAASECYTPCGTD